MSYLFTSITTALLIYFLIEDRKEQEGWRAISVFLGVLSAMVTVFLTRHGM